METYTQEPSVSPAGAEHMVEWLFHWPIAMSVLWWRLMVHAAQPCWHAAPAHADLRLPQGIEDDGEHALFA